MKQRGVKELTCDTAQKPKCCAVHLHIDSILQERVEREPHKGAGGNQRNERHVLQGHDVNHTAHAKDHFQHCHCDQCAAQSEPEPHSKRHIRIVSRLNIATCFDEAESAHLSITTPADGADSAPTAGNRMEKIAA